MDMQELLTNFNALLENYAEHRNYIRRAKTQSDKFSPAVIEKVVLDHEIKSSGVADELLPLVPEIEAQLRQIDDEKASINNRKARADEQMEELQLRQAIGELSDEDFESLGGDLRAELDLANGRLEALDGDRGQLQGALDRWVDLAVEAGQDPGTATADAADAGDVAPEPVGDTPVVVETSDGTHSSTDHIQEDVSAVFDDADADAVSVSMDDDGETIEAGEEVDFGFEEDDNGSQAGAEVELNLTGGSAESREAGADEIGIDLDAVEAESDAVASADDEDEDAGSADASGDAAPAASDDEPRRALLLYQEGTAEEQIYPFTGEVLTIGRGRDNDIQIKNDSKVSRFHCKLFRRGGNFYIEDNKSSNGSLVNGELITERRLFGGEEVIIGETFFRFRIM